MFCFRSWCWSTLPNQPAPLQPCLCGSSEAHLLKRSSAMLCIQNFLTYNLRCLHCATVLYLFWKTAVFCLSKVKVNSVSFFKCFKYEEGVFFLQKFLIYTSSKYKKGFCSIYNEKSMKKEYFRIRTTITFAVQ